MNKAAIKNFAIWARNKLIADISYRAGLMGIKSDGIENALPQSTPSTEFYNIGTENPYSISGDAIKQRRRLVEVIRRKENESDYATAYKYIIEEVAYTWFNRLIAIRFMEVNDYLPSHMRVLSSDTGKLEPDIVTNICDAELELTAEEREKVIQLKTENLLDELFCMLFIKQCNALNEYLPELFEKTNDYTELLLNISVIDKDGVVYKLVHDISEDDFNIEKGGQVEIIGWLYQYYNTEPKAEVFGRPSGTKIRKEDVPAATQLFTPDWIVRYMVENSLGRLWVEGHPNDELKSNWKYYLEEAKQEPEVEEKLAEIRREYAGLNPEDIKIIDPCMGSGHILVYAFDVLMQIYESTGYGQRDAARSILENNIYGLDIDDRAFQLAYFAVMMKARQYNRRILTGEYKPNLYSIKESNAVNRAHIKYFGMGLSEVDKEKAITQINGLLDTFIDAKEYGSILTVEEYDWELLERFIEDSDSSGQISMETVGIEDTKERLLQLIAQGKVLGEKYWVAVTNPPYMGNMPFKTTEYIKEYYIDEKYDLYSVFIKRCSDFIVRNGITSIITQHTWMFISSFEKFREKLMMKNYISILHLGTRAFEEIGGEVVQTVVTICRNTFIHNIKVTVNRLVDYLYAKEKEKAYLENKNVYTIKQDNFNLLPGKPIVYWLQDSYFSALEKKSFIRLFVEKKAGVVTGNDNYFVKVWYEPAFYDISFTGAKHLEYSKYHIMSKGGSACRFYGNYEYVIRIKDLWDERKTNTSVRRGDSSFYFKKAIGWSQVGNAQKTFRYIENSICGTATPTIYLKDERFFNYILGFLNTKIAFEYLNAYNPTINLLTTDICNLPLIMDDSALIIVDRLINLSIYISKSDWDSYETSWDFKYHPLIKNFICDTTIATEPRTIFDTYHSWVSECEQRFLELKANEEELNRIFIDIYGLKDELTSEVLDKDITVHRIFDSKEDVPESMKGLAYIRTKCDEIVSLLSYAIGCMFGRYSLDSEGLAYAGGEWDESKYDTFKPDADNIIPLTDEEYLEDDIIVRLCTWLKVVYGEDTLEENLDFIAKALGNKGNTSREIIRNYFLNDFFKDHCQTYSVTGSGKRPIYWLFDSGKQNGFKALIYLHRYNADTIGNLRIDYLHHMQRIYESESSRMQDTIDHSTNAREVATATKRREKLQKQLKECREYDEKIAHLALSRIELDLDDGVKVNYRKLQTAADGKFYEVLADSKNIMSKK